MISDSFNGDEAETIVQAVQANLQQLALQLGQPHDAAATKQLHKSA